MQINNQGTLDVDRLLFIDETGFQFHLSRHYTRSLRGNRATVSEPLLKKSLNDT